MQKKIPMRQCLGCREMKPKRELLRIVRLQDGTITADLTGKAQGRGAYICRDAACIRKAVKYKALDKALSANVTDDLEERLLQIAEENHD